MNQELIALILATAAYYKETFQDAVVEMYAEDLSDLPLSEIKRVLVEIRRDPKNTRFPLPAMIRSRIIPPETDEDEGRAAASRIIAAIAKYGWPNPDQARAFIGELGWAVVEGQGGWPTVCRMVDESNIGIFQAQCRDLAATLRRREKAGLSNTPPRLVSIARPVERHLVEIK